MNTETTSRGYEVVGPDKDGELGVEFRFMRCWLLFTAADLRMMLERFEKEGK